MEMKLHQPAMSVDEQIENLKLNRLVILDEDHAKSFLSGVIAHLNSSIFANHTP